MSTQLILKCTRNKESIEVQSHQDSDHKAKVNERAANNTMWLLPFFSDEKQCNSQFMEQPHLY